MKNQFSLMKDLRFWPLFAAQFTGAFNDNIFKTLISVLVAYGAWTTGSLPSEVVVSVTVGFLILPFILFAPIAGDIADKYDKAKVLSALKFLELFALAAAIMAILSGSVWFSLLVLFALGTQAAFFSPGKFSILPQHLEERELIGGNAVLNTGTYIAILTGTIIGTVCALSGVGRGFIILILIVSGAVGYLASRKIPTAPPPSPDIILNFNIAGEIVGLVNFARTQPDDVFRAIIGCAWFYFTGATLLSQFPNFTKHILNAGTDVLAFFMILFSLGIAFGGLLNEKLLKGKVDAKYVPAAAVAMAIFLFDLYLASGHEAFPDLGKLLMNLWGWRIIIDMLAIAVAGGIYVVPLKAIVQNRSAPERRARVLAASAMIDSLFILSSSILAAGLLSLGFDVPHLFAFLAVASCAVGWYLRGLKGKS